MQMIFEKIILMKIIFACVYANLFFDEDFSPWVLQIPLFSRNVTIAVEVQ